jgi:hypothetical protein
MRESLADSDSGWTILPAPRDSLVSVLGVVYAHRTTSDGGDLYLTRWGLPVAELLELDAWHEKSWFEAHRERLDGTSAVYRVRTKAIAGRSLELVVKNCRVGEDVPIDTRSLLEFVNTEFNSPWEEFALVIELREGKHGPKETRIQTQDPLAIYVPPERMQIWQSGRSQAKINRIRARHPGIELDILRQYKLIYGWIKGKDALHVLRDAQLGKTELSRELDPLNRKVIGDLEQKGYAVADMKAQHIVLEEQDVRLLEQLPAHASSQLARTRSDALRDLVQRGCYWVIDYELLFRTAEHEARVNAERRHSYLDDMRDRYLPTALPPNLAGVDLLGVPYVTGQAESTGGQLWVVGRNGRLFDYFLPERWRRTHAWKLSDTSEVYYTVTKDQIHLVWKISRVGERPLVLPGDPAAAQIEAQGYNSPFEEFAIATQLAERGIPTVYVRAIYRTGTSKLEPSTDCRRYASHRELRGPDSEPVLLEGHNYITLRGYYNGPDAWVAEQTGQLDRPVDLAQAVHHGLLPREDADRQYQRIMAELRNVGFDGSLLQHNDFLLVLDPRGEFVRTQEGRPELRVSNFELLRATSAEEVGAERA